MKQDLLNIIINHAPDNPIKSAVLEEYLGIPGTQVRDLVRALRSDGENICSSSLGYYYSTDPKHIEATINSLERRARSEMKTAAAMRRKFNITSQTEIKF